MNCKKCNVELNDNNWYPSQKRIGIFRCKFCHCKQQSQYNLLNQEKNNLYKRNYYNNEKGKEICKRKSKKYTLTQRGKDSMKRARYKRIRNLGFNELNTFFEGSEPHHINKNDVIYIPKEWNRIISHNIYTWKNMDSINAMAYFFLLQQNIKEFNYDK